MWSYMEVEVYLLDKSICDGKCVHLQYKFV